MSRMYYQGVEELSLRTMESDASDAIRFCQEKRMIKLVVRYNPKKGWSVDHKYCCPKHQPTEILDKRQKVKDVS